VVIVVDFLKKDTIEMKKKVIFVLTVGFSVVGVFAQEDARLAYQQRQAVQEVQRLSSQFDHLQSGMEGLSARMNKLERADGSGDLRAEIGAIKSELAQLKRRQDAMRQEIVSEISKKMADLMAKNRPAPASAPSRKSSARASAPAEEAATGPTGPYYEHTIEPGETLSYIARECNTTVSKIKQYNNMKSNMLRVGQVLKIPAEEEKKK
jgi:LysM repeat protein